MIKICRLKRLRNLVVCFSVSGGCFRGRQTWTIRISISNRPFSDSGRSTTRTAPTARSCASKMFRADTSIRSTTASKKKSEIIWTISWRFMKNTWEATTLESCWELLFTFVYLEKTHFWKSEISATFCTSLKRFVEARTSSFTMIRYWLKFTREICSKFISLEKICQWHEELDSNL